MYEAILAVPALEKARPFPATLRQKRRHERRLVKLAIREFGHIWQGYSRVQTIRDWVNQRVTFTPNTSDSNTSAVEVTVAAGGLADGFYSGNVDIQSNGGNATLVGVSALRRLVRGD